jgi:DNA-binding MarR family transcriptional regulator
MKGEIRDKLGSKLPAEASLSCVGYRVRRLSRVVSAIYDEAFGPLKLKISQFGILMMLTRRGPSTAADLCRLVNMEKSTASRNLQRMRRRGWISAAQDGSGPAQKISLTPQGAQVLQKAVPLWRRAQEEAARRLGADGMKALEVVVTRMQE